MNQQSVNKNFFQEFFEEVMWCKYIYDEADEQSVSVFCC